MCNLNKKRIVSFSGVGKSGGRAEGRADGVPYEKWKEERMGSR